MLCPECINQGSLSGLNKWDLLHSHGALFSFCVPYTAQLWEVIDWMTSPSSVGVVMQTSFSVMVSIDILRWLCNHIRQAQGYVIYDDPMFLSHLKDRKINFPMKQSLYRGHEMGTLLYWCFAVKPTNTLRGLNSNTGHPRFAPLHFCPLLLTSGSSVSLFCSPKPIAASLCSLRKWFHNLSNLTLKPHVSISGG